MIELTRLDGTGILINENFMETVQEAPDTVITMQNGHIYIVSENMEQIMSAINKENN